MILGYWQSGPSGAKDANGNPLPGDRFQISKDGRRKRDGGDGVRWSCGCAQFSKLKFREEQAAEREDRPERQTRCKHINEVFSSATDNKPLPPEFVLNATGRRAAKRCVCRAVRESIR